MHLCIILRRGFVEFTRLPKRLRTKKTKQKISLNSGESPGTKIFLEEILLFVGKAKIVCFQGASVYAKRPLHCNEEGLRVPGSGISMGLWQASPSMYLDHPLCYQSFSSLSLCRHSPIVCLWHLVTWLTCVCSWHIPFKVHVLVSCPTWWVTHLSYVTCMSTYEFHILVTCPLGNSSLIGWHVFDM